MPSGSTIQFTGLDRQYKSLREEILHVSDEVYSTGQVLDGANTKEFEDQIAKLTNRTYALTFNSCSQALLCSYIYLTNHYPQRNVAVPAMSFIATAGQPRLAGWNVKFIDVDKNSILDLDHLDIYRDSIDVISYVNMFGNSIDYDKLRLITSFFSKDVYVVEDAAQSFGASYKGIPSGKMGDISCLSFDPTKNLPNYGSGGMFLTDDTLAYDFARNFKDNGKASGFELNGTNSKMSEVDCAQMIVKLKYFDAWQDRRTKIATFYNECLSEYVTCPTVTPDSVHAWHKYVINTFERDNIATYLKSKNIETKIHYRDTLNSHGIFRTLDLTNLPTAVKLSHTSLSLPIYPELLDEEVEYVVDMVQKFYD
jgi:dTDP-4-amino-4,6-dideoxygalactose transaminase